VFSNWTDRIDPEANASLGDVAVVAAEGEASHTSPTAAASVLLRKHRNSSSCWRRRRNGLWRKRRRRVMMMMRVQLIIQRHWSSNFPYIYIMLPSTLARPGKLRRSISVSPSMRRFLLVIYLEGSDNKRKRPAAVGCWHFCLLLLVAGMCYLVVGGEKVMKYM